MDTKFKEIGLPCPCGKSSDAYSINHDGSGKCFSCGDFHPNKGNQLVVEIFNDKGRRVEHREEDKSEYIYYPHRGLARSTLEFYDIKTKFGDGEPQETGFIFPSGGVRIRRLSDQVARKDKWISKGSFTDCGLFGRDKFSPGSKDSVTIVEGCYDAPSAFELLLGKSACVSVNSAATAKRDCIKDWDWINSFKKIYLAFDNDDAGRHALEQVAPLFDFKKVYHVHLTTKKDANEYLTENASEEFRKAHENARRFSPDNIISSFADILGALKKDTESQVSTYPFKELQSKTYGKHEGEIIVLKARRGVGKTELFRAMEHHDLKTTEISIGIIHLEEDNGTTVKAIAGYELGIPAVLPDCGLSDDDIMAGYKAAVKDDENRVHIYTSFDKEDEDKLYNNIRFLVAVGCRGIYLDHITWLATGKDDEDERRKLDRISQNLKLLAKELRIFICEISHVNAAGGSRGSANIENVANTIISLDRDEKSPDPFTRSCVSFMLEKVRLGGQTGPAGRAIMNHSTGRLEELTDEYSHNPQMEFTL